MNRAMFSGVAGLKTHQTRMDVIGNNIANVNTVGYKSQTALFSDLLYQNSSNATGPNADTNIGGINAKQVGLGAKMASINTNITLPGSAETTNNPFDIRLTGDSFLIVNNGSQNMFTRDGSFKVDAAGNLVMSSNGYMVMGWQPDTENPQVIKQDTVSALQIMSAANMTYPAEATKQAYISGIVDAESPEVAKDGKIMNLNFYDARGYSYTAKLAIRKAAADTAGGKVNSYECTLEKLLNAKGEDITTSVNAQIQTDTKGKYNVIPFKDPLVITDKIPAAADLTIAGGGTAPYTLTTKRDANGYYTVYTINADGSATAEYKQVVVTGTAPNLTLANPAATDKVLEFPSTRDGLKELAAFFGCNEIGELARMTAKGKTDNTKDIIGIHQILSDQGFSETSRTVTFNGQTGAIINFSKDNGFFKGMNGDTEGNVSTVLLTFSGVGDAASLSDITIDFSTLKNLGNEKTSTAGATAGSLKNEGAGRMVGKMSGVTIGTEGKIYATYDNGQSKLIGQIAVARFANPAGLQKAGDNLYTSSQNSGEFDGIGVDVTSDGGKMTPGELEMSNVDLSGELTGMIITQRGFQANSRIITVSDTMLEELINLKR